jgi:hypothetical protein
MTIVGRNMEGRSGHRKYRCVLLCTALLLAPAPLMAEPWVKSFVVDKYEPAFYYGGRPGVEKAGVIEPGVDCPAGTLPMLDFAKVVKTPWRSDEEVASWVKPAQVTDLQTVHYMQERILTYRSFRRDIVSYLNPFTVPDPGMPSVVGKIAEGFNLDGNVKTGGFTNIRGEKGVDNAYYRALGCIGSFRGVPYTAAMSVRSNDKMLEGMYTMVIRLSGNKDPRNDDAATLEIGYSPDRVNKQTDGRASTSYSFRIVKNEQYSKVKAVIRNGVVETEQVSELHMPRFGWFPNQMGDADFHQGRVRLEIGPDGFASGLVGGYRDWRDLYSEDTFTQSGSTIETRDHHDVIGMYYALKRNADGMPDPKTGEKMGISIAYRVKAVPAYVVDPEGPLSAGLLAADKRATQKYQMMRQLFYKGIATATIQANPKGSSEGAPQLRQRADGSWTNSDGERNGLRDASPPIGPSTMLQQKVNNEEAERTVQPVSAR